MYGGRLRRVKFKYTGYSVEDVMDRLPTAVIEKEYNGEYTIFAEVFGNSIIKANAWVRLNAKVYGNAVITNGAKIGRDTVICNNSTIRQ
jgi:UDP-3-O-[3-hydroxymyristoyl] glucosamine N-acyltransferase